MDRRSHCCPLPVLLGGITWILFVVQTSARNAGHTERRPPGLRHNTASALRPHLRGLRYFHAVRAGSVVQSVPPVTLDPQLATNSKSPSSTEALLGRRLAAFCATATRHSSWSSLEAAVQDNPDAAAFVSFAFSFWLYIPPTLEQRHANWPPRYSAH